MATEMKVVWEMATAWTKDWTTSNGIRRGGNRKLLPHVGPLLMTLLRLCVESIGTRSNFAVQVLFNWMGEDDADDKGFC